MDREWILNDRILKRINDVLETCSEAMKVEIESIVLFGSKARGDRNSQNDYEIMILVSNETNIKDYVKLINTIRLEILKEKLFTSQILVYTSEIFEDILYNDKITGTFLYMICRENIILFDKYNTFRAIKERITNGSVKEEEEFINQCIEFAKIFGSDKWAQKWEKNLMQYKYLKKRRDY